jgi:hypothetical protein
MPLTKEQFDKLDAEGFTPEEIAGFEQQRMGGQSIQQPIQQPQQQGGVLQQLLGMVANPQDVMTGSLATGVDVSMNRGPAALRSGIMGQGMAQGFNNPSQTPSFGQATQEQLPIRASDIGTLTADLALRGPLILGANILDEITNPVNLAMDAAGIYGAMKYGPKIAKNVAANAKKFTTIENNLNLARKADVALETMRDTIGKVKGVAISEVAEEATKANFGLLNKIPEVKNWVLKPVYEIEMAGDSIKQTVKNLDKVKGAIGDWMRTPKAWAEAGDKTEEVAKQLYGEISGAMKIAARKAGKPIDSQIKAYEEFMTRYTNVKKTLVDAHKQVISKKIKAAFTIGAEDVVKESWKELSKGTKFFKGDATLKAIMGNMERRNLVRNLLKIPMRAKEGF